MSSATAAGGRRARWWTLALCVACVAGLGLPAAGAPAEERPPPTVLRTLPLSGVHEGTSGPVAAPLPFTMVGFDVPDRAHLRFRTSTDGRAWSPWSPAPTFAQEGEAPAPAAGGPDWASSTELQWVGDARWIEVDVRGGPVGGTAVHFVDTRGRAVPMPTRAREALAALARPAPAHARMARPEMVSRRDWGAGPSGKPRYHAGVKAATLHHTAGSNAYACRDAPGIVRAIWSYHARTLGWADIGYHFVVDRCGTIYEGRAGGVDRPVLGAHAGGFNTGTFGVSILGEFSDGLPSAQAREAVARVVAWKFTVHDVKADGRVTLTSTGSTRYPRGRQVTVPTLFGHRDVSRTACPGDRLYRELPRLRQRVGDLMASRGLLPALP
jgi:uncharacterized protein with LGFP repeats